MLVCPPWVSTVEEADALIAGYAAVVAASRDEDVRRSYRIAIDEVLERRELLVRCRPSDEPR
jgi:predicted metal-binding protein